MHIQKSSHWHGIDILNILKIIGDIIMISTLKTLFNNSNNFDKKKTRAYLIVTLVVGILNILGIYRNSFTLWKYQDFMSYFWLGSDILQLIIVSLCFCFFYQGVKIDYRASIFLLFSLIAVLILNVYNFLVNFSWLPYEGISVFIFWFINNGTMIAYPIMVLYILFFIEAKTA
jgi:hypothetical protein